MEKPGPVFTYHGKLLGPNYVVWKTRAAILRGEGFFGFYP